MELQRLWFRNHRMFALWVLFDPFWLEFSSVVLI
jgi:hypothetical protein